MQEENRMGSYGWTILDVNERPSPFAKWCVLLYVARPTPSV